MEAGARGRGRSVGQYVALALAAEKMTLRSVLCADWKVSGGRSVGRTLHSERVIFKAGAAAARAQKYLK